MTDQWERRELYDNMLNDVYGTVSICGMAYDASIALERIDPIAYTLGLTEWEDEQSVDEEFGD